jgi:hypothetical protein
MAAGKEYHNRIRGREISIDHETGSTRENMSVF